jgi:uncharacterized MAPEG superfamily protein
MLLSYWGLLGFVAWTLLLLVLGIGVTRVGQVLRRQAPANSFNPQVPHGTESYQRRMRAHLNCVENLPIFASLVLLGGLLGVSSAAFQAAAFAVLPLRVGQSVAHIASGRNRAVLVRFGFFSAQLVCFAILLALLVKRGMDLPKGQP